MSIDAIDCKNLGQVIATMSLPAVLGPILGPALGGLIPTFASWRWMFWVNVLFCVVGLVLAVRMPPADRPDQRARLDLVGLALSGASSGGPPTGPERRRVQDRSRHRGVGRHDLGQARSYGVVVTVEHPPGPFSTSDATGPCGRHAAVPAAA